VSGFGRTVADASCGVMRFNAVKQGRAF